MCIRDSDYPLCKSIDEKMIAIDTLIHSFHMDMKLNLPNRAAGNNLIEGSFKSVMDALNKLSGVQPQNDIVFSQTSEIMWKRRRSLI